MSLVNGAVEGESKNESTHLGGGEGRCPSSLPG